MRLRLDTTPEELAAKGGLLLQALAKSLGAAAPDLSEALNTATLPRKQPELKYPVLRELHDRTRQAYAEQVQKMLADIGRVLDRSAFQKAEGYDYTQPIVQRESIALARIREVLQNRGYGPEDFLPGGRLYAMPINELIDVARGDRRE